MFRKRSQTSGVTVTDLRDLSLRSLQVFTAVAEAGSLTAAAQRLGGTLSAVSQQVTNLEKVVGAVLLDRTVRPVLLTPVGQTLLQHAHKILQAVGEARAALLEPRLGSWVEIRLGIIDDLDATLAPELVTRLRTRYPRSQITVTSGRSDALCDALVQREVDLILTGHVPESLATALGGHEDLPVFREPFMIVAPRGCLDGAADLRGQMQSRTFVRFNASMPIGRVAAQHLQRLRIDLSAPFSFDASRSVFAMMARCGGWSITTPLCVLDAGENSSTVDCFKMPFAGLERTVRVVARREELGGLPGETAQITRELITASVLPATGALAPWLLDECFVVAEAR
jgi:DNA-binding transcriptional LysR family regulator